MGVEDEGSTIEYTVLPGASVVTARALVMIDVRIARLTGVIENATCDAVRVAAIDGRGEARAERFEILLTHALDRPSPG